MVIILGIAGGGKSYQSERLAADGQYHWVSVGELLRHARLTAETKHQLLTGHVIDESVVYPLVSAEFEKGDKPELLLDGFPRTLAEAEWLTKYITDQKIKLRALLHIGVSREVSVARLLARGRDDDTPTAITERFDEYVATIGPILQHFRDNNYDVFEIHGEGTRQEVSGAIDAVLRDTVRG